MKKIIIIMLLISSSVFSQTYTGLLVQSMPVGFFGFCTYDYINSRSAETQDNNGLTIGFTLDPRMAMDSAALNSQIKIGYKHARLEPYLSYENFHLLGFNYYSIGINYMLINRKAALLAGIETGYIHNRASKNSTYVWNEWSKLGVNLESRYKLNENLYLTAIINVMDRPDVPSKKFVTSVGIGVTFIN